MDNLDALLGFSAFMALVGAFPSEDERRVMTAGDFIYALLTRFLNNVSMNIRAVNPAMGAMAQRIDTTRKEASGATEHKITDTVVAAPVVPAPVVAKETA